MNDSAHNPHNDIRRHLVLGLAIVFLLVSFAAYQFGDDSWGDFAGGSCGRLGLVMGALWLAWPSLQKPASWLPPGIAFGIVLGLMALAMNPRLVVVVVPALGILGFLGSIIRGLRNSK